MAIRQTLPYRAVRSVYKRGIQGPAWQAELRYKHLAQVATTKRLLDWFGNVVSDGPYAGMLYVDDPLAESSIPPKLTGTYELELRPTIEAAIALQPKRVVDVGCAAGYHLIGLATRLPAATVYGFDPDTHKRDHARRVAEANGVADRVKLAGFARPEELQRLAGPDSLVFVDVDGDEIDVLDPEAVPALAETPMFIIELHDFATRRISTTISKRFRATHHIEFIHPRLREPHPAEGMLPRHLRRWLTDERRPPGQRWAVLTLIEVDSRPRGPAAESNGDVNIIKL